VAIDEQLLAIVADNREGVLATIGKSGRPQLSNILYVWDSGQRTVRISTTADRVKARNLQRDPRAGLYVVGPHFWAWVVADGDAELIGPTTTSGDDAGCELLQVHSAFYGQQDEPEFFEQMVAARRLVIRLKVNHTYGLRLDQPPGG
jgi:PPOX class probable F420-dependent enzyme